MPQQSEVCELPLWVTFAIRHRIFMWESNDCDRILGKSSCLFDATLLFHPPIAFYFVPFLAVVAAYTLTCCCLCGKPYLLDLSFCHYSCWTLMVCTSLQMKLTSSAQELRSKQFACAGSRKVMTPVNVHNPERRYTVLSESRRIGQVTILGVSAMPGMIYCAGALVASIR